uniref:hypothetical protein n=1 Tax=Flavobacterium sp. TaxID=239 RepID=UPI00404AC75F
MKINNIEGLSVSQINTLVRNGGKFVIFPYTVSFVLMTLRRNSDIYFIKPDDVSIKYSYPYVLINFFIGWWGIPWGPIYTIGAIYRHLSGGKDVTEAVMSSLVQSQPVENTATYDLNTASTYNLNTEQSNNETYNIPRN